MIDRFFRPFFGGIMLDSQLQVSSRMLEYVFRMMAEGDTVLPAMGMGAIPLQMAAKLPQGNIHYGSRVIAVESNRVKLATGDAVEAAAVVVATEGAEAVRLLPELPQIAARKVMTLYFAIDGPAPILDPIILLNGSLEWPIQNACVPSVVCPTYAPSGRHLMSVTVLGDPVQRDKEVEAKVRLQLARWLNQDVGGWKLLRIYRIPNAHPVPIPDTIVERPVRLKNGIFVCGDHRFMASIQAALLNGRHAAEAVAAHVA